jgi:cell division protein FtsA
MVKVDETIEVESVGGRQPRNVPRMSLCKIIEARAEETLKLVQAELAKHELVGKLGSGVILTGGGSELTGLVEMGDFIFDMPVRLGHPKKVGGLSDVVKSSRYATALGLVMYGYEQNKERIIETDGDEGVP